MSDSLGLSEDESVSKLLHGFRDSGHVVVSGLIFRYYEVVSPAEPSSSSLGTSLPVAINPLSMKKRLYAFLITDQAFYLLRQRDYSLKSRVLWSDVAEVQLFSSLEGPLHDAFCISMLRPSSSLLLLPHPEGLSKLEILACFPARVVVSSVSEDDFRFPGDSDLSDSDHEDGKPSMTKRHLVGSKRISKEALIENPYYAKKEEEMFTSGDGFLLANVVRTEFLTGTLRTVLERDKQKSFRQLLTQFEELADHHIQSVCSDHYQTFLNAFSELPLIDEDCARVRQSVAELNREFQEVGHEYVEALDALQRARYVAQNLSKARDSIALCSRLASIGCKIEQLIREKKYYPALKALHKLEIQLPLHLAFGRFMATKIPRLRSNIKATVLADFNEWLVQVRDFSVVLGNRMLDALKSQVDAVGTRGEYCPSHYTLSHVLQSSAAVLYEASTGFNVESSRSGRASRHRSGTIKINRATPYLEDSSGNSTSTVDFSALYTCSHVHQSLREDDTFRSYYMQNRRKQIELDLVARRPTVRDYFSRIVGFFVVETRVAKSASHLMPAGEMSSIWDEIVEKLKSVINERVEKLKTSEEWVSLKNELIVGGMCLQVLGLHVTPFFDFVESWKDRYANSVLLPMFRQKLDIVLAADRYDFMLVTSQTQFDALIAKYNLGSEVLSKFGGDLQQRKWPISLSFSSAVPSILVTIEESVKTFLEFGQFLVPVDESAKRVVDELVRYVGQRYESILTDIAFSNIVQCGLIGANCSALHVACSALEFHVLSLLSVCTAVTERVFGHGDREVDQAARPRDIADSSLSLLSRKEFLSARTVLLQSKSSSDDFVFKSLKMKADEFIGIGFSIDWLLAAPPQRTSDHIEDLGQFVQTTFSMLEIIPRATLASLEQRTAMYIAEQMIDVAVQAAVRQVTRYGLAQLDADMGYMEKVFQKYGRDFGRPFAEIRNSLAVLLTVDPVNQRSEQDVRTMLMSTSSSENLKKFLIIREKIREPPKESVRKSTSRNGLFRSSKH